MFIGSTYRALNGSTRSLVTETRAPVLARLLVVLTWIALTASSLFCAPCFDLFQGFLDGLGTQVPGS